MTTTARQRAAARWTTDTARREQARREIQQTWTYDLHAREAAPELEQDALPGLTPEPEPEPPRGPLCWHCATTRLTRRDDRLCPACARAGADPIWIPCTRPGHDHVRRRRVRGQQHFTCNERTDR